MTKSALPDFHTASPKISDIRQTPYLVRKEIMESVGILIKGGYVLDLFAGSGALGLDALKIGALRTTFVDISENCIRAVRNLIKSHHLEGRVRVYKGSAEAFVEKAPQGRYHVIFFTPPYLNLHLHLLPKLRRILVNDGQIVFEHPPSLSTAHLEKEAKFFGVRETRNYGWSRISFLTLKTDQDKQLT